MEYDYHYRPTFKTFSQKEESMLIIGQFIFRHKGKKVKGRKNYPPLPTVLWTGRKKRFAVRGLRRAQRMEDLARLQIGPGSHERVERAAEHVRTIVENNPELARLRKIRLRHATNFYIKD